MENVHVGPIASLTDGQAIRAVKYFFDFSPPELWEDGQKPSPDRVKQIAAALVAQSPDDVKPAVAALVDDVETAATPARAQVCRLILTQLSQSPAFESTVERAVETSRLPHKMIDPVTGAFILAFLLATTQIERTPDGWKFRGAGGAMEVIGNLHLPELLHELPPVIKALPQGIWAALTGKS